MSVNRDEKGHDGSEINLCEIRPLVTLRVRNCVHVGVLLVIESCLYFKFAGGIAITKKSISLINNTVNGEFNPDNAEPEENETSIVTVEEEEKTDPTDRTGLFAMDSFGFRRLQINRLSDKIIHYPSRFLAAKSQG